MGRRTAVRSCRARVARPQGSSSVVFLGAVAPAYRLLDRMTDSYGIAVLWDGRYEQKAVERRA